MASRHFLTGYTIKILNKSNYVVSDFSEIDSKKLEIFDYLKEAMYEHATMSTFEDTQKTFQIHQLNRIKDENVMFGVIKSGNYGDEGELTHIQREEVIAKTREHSDVRRFYFEIYAPSGYDKAIILLESVGVSGIKSIFTQVIINYFKQNYKDYSVAILPIYRAKKFKEMLENAKAVTLTFRKLGLPIDPVDVLDADQERKGRKLQTKLQMLGLSGSGILSYLRKHKLLKSIGSESDELFQIENIPTMYDEEWQRMDVTVEEEGKDGKTKQETFPHWNLGNCLYKDTINPNLYKKSDNEYYKNLPPIAHGKCIEIAPKIGFLGAVLRFPEEASHIEDCL